MTAHTHVVAVLLTSPYITSKSLLLALYTGPCTSDGIARLFASLTKDLSVLRTLVAGSTTDGAPALIAGLSLFSESNYSKYLPKNLVRGLHSRCADHLIDLALRNAL